MAQEQAGGPRRGSVMRSFSALGNSMTKDIHHGMKIELIHPRRVPLISNPLKGVEEEHGHGHAPVAPHPPLKHADSSDGSDDEHPEKGQEFDPHDHEPVLRYHHESPTIQLFYDLFFVANITTFTSQHEVSNVNGKLSNILKSSSNFH
jgi:hypothetical protein